jgi:polar amino acid transport system substrate-binding protein
VLAGGCAALGFGNTLDRIKRDGVVRVGHAGERPYAYEEAGVLVGATVAVHRAVSGGSEISSSRAYTPGSAS